MEKMGLFKSLQMRVFQQPPSQVAWICAIERPMRTVRIPHFAFISMLLTILSACSSDDKPWLYDETEYPRSDYPLPEYYHLPPDGLSGLGRTVKVNCADSTDCNPSVAVVLMRKEGSVGRCMGSVIGDDEILTAGHCIPDQLQEGDGCNDSMAFFFGKIGEYPEQKIECARLIKIQRPDDRNTNVLDFAILKTDKKINRPSLPLRTTGMPADSELKLYTATANDQYNKFDFELTLRSKICKTLQGSYLAPSNSKPFNNTMSLGQCTKDFQRGDSGGALLDSDGRVAGIAHAYIPSGETIHTGRVSFSIKVNAVNRRILNLASMVACLPHLVTDSLTLKECSRKVSFSDILNAEAAKTQNVEAVVPQGTPFVWKYELFDFDEDAHLVLLPNCFRPFAEWKEKFSNLGQIESIAFEGLTFNVIDFELNSYLQISSMTAGKTFIAAIEFNPIAFEHDGTTPVSVMFEKPDGTFISLSRLLMACPENRTGNLFL
jgi:hypothetical protein